MDLDIDEILWCPRGKNDLPDPMHPFKCYRTDKKLLVKAKRTLAAAAEFRAKLVADLGEPPPAPSCPHCGRKARDGQLGFEYQPSKVVCKEKYPKPSPHINFTECFECEPKDSSTQRYHFRSGTIRKPNDDETNEDGRCCKCPP